MHFDGYSHNCIGEFVFSFKHFFTALFLCELCAFAVHDFIATLPR